MVVKLGSRDLAGEEFLKIHLCQRILHWVADDDNVPVKVGRHAKHMLLGARLDRD